MMPTIKDVATRAQVSFTTVSHVLNQTRKVNDATRQSVLQAAQDLDYVPSALARSLKSRRTFTIGLMLPNNSNPYFAEIARGIEDASFEAGFNVILCNSYDRPEKQVRYLQVLMEKQVDGLIVLTSGGPEQPGHPLSRIGVPLVVVDREVGDLGADLVEVNHRLGGEIATAHLLALGHTSVACIAGPLALSVTQQRLEGYRHALRAANAEDIQAQIEVADFSCAGGHAAMQRLLQQSAPPTAVFACNDLMAIGAISAASSAGRRVPDDLAVVGFDDIEWASHTSPPLTTVSQPKAELGHLAARMLFERLAQPDTPPRKVILQPHLQIRASCGTCATG
jgi:LacI family transcriptional regulator